MNILVYEDELVTQLYPATTGRPAFRITIASRCLADWLGMLEGKLSAAVRPHLRPTLELENRGLFEPPDPQLPWTLLVNARLVPSQESLAQLQQLGLADEPLRLVDPRERLAAAVVPTAGAIRLFGPGLEPRSQLAIGELAAAAPAVSGTADLLHYPHDLIRHNLAAFSGNIEHRIRSGSYRQIADGVFTGEDVAISDYVVTNTRGGPIVIESGTVIGPFCFLRGPVHIGAGSRINEHAAIKDAVSIGQTCKVGGEVEGSVIESFSNKQHHGFLGHSHLGSWINLGAGTCNSDLKNSYGEVKMEYRGERVATGMQFVGCVMGDYSKTAINTSIFTGKTIGVCSMLYGFVTTNVPSFSNYARTFNQVTESPPTIMELTQKRMFSRRQVEQRQADIDLLHAMFELTRHERQLAEEPLNL